jgi:UDP-N-acetylglucosamine 2-epimerase (non-hydrolysing)
MRIGSASSSSDGAGEPVARSLRLSLCGPVDRIATRGRCGRARARRKHRGPDGKHRRADGGDDAKPRAAAAAWTRPGAPSYHAASAPDLRTRAPATRHDGVSERPAGRAVSIVTITGIRPDFIRMSEVFVKLDEAFDHVMIHTGQHYDDELSQVFFNELAIRRPDYVLETGIESRNHYEQLSYLSKAVIELLRREKLAPELILFLGDSNSALVSVPLFKEGYRIGHIEGGMRSYDRRMPEEVNRVICDYVSDHVFVYTELYRDRLLRENKPPDGIFVVGNTIVEVVKKYMPSGERPRDYIVADIHRNENLRDPQQYAHVLAYLNGLGIELGLPVKLVRFNRAVRIIEAHDLLADKPQLELVGPFGFLDYLRLQYRACAVVSDSGTSQEECPLLGVPVAVPRNSTERPESLEAGNSILVGETRPIAEMISDSVNFFASYTVSAQQLEWLGDGRTSQRIVDIIQRELQQ